jgi:hypothetical protein
MGFVLLGSVLRFDIGTSPAQLKGDAVAASHVSADATLRAIIDRMASSLEEHRRLLAESLAQADRDIGELRGQLIDREALEAEVRALRVECGQLRTDLAGVTGSLSWRITAPLRVVRARSRRRRA